MVGNEFLQPVVLPLYGSFISEERHGLFGDVAGKRVLELGCGNGQSLQYLGQRRAAELWGFDLSPKQLEKARLLLEGCGLSAHLICSPMEEDCGLAPDYFDIVYSIYAIGWTTDLAGTFRRIASCLKKDGRFIFSWSHPIHKCVSRQNDAFVFSRCYFDEAWYPVPADFCRGELTLADRTLSTYVNALAAAGFAIEQMVEESDADILQAGDQSDFAERARMFPVTFVIKARKL